MYVYTHTQEYYSAMKKKKIMPFEAAWMDLEMIILSEVSQKEKDKYHMISFICGIYSANEHICNTDKKKKSHVILSTTPRDWPTQTGPTARLRYLLQTSYAEGGGSCSQLDSPVPQRATLPLVAEAENGKPLQCKSSPFVSGPPGTVLQTAPGGSRAKHL